MTATRRFERSVAIRSEPGAIEAELADPQRQIGLQPLLVSVSEIDGGDSTRTRHFEAIEIVRVFGCVKLRNRIRVRIHVTRPGEVVEFEASSFPGIVVHSRFTLSRVESGTHVREEVRLEAPILLRGFVASEAMRAQEELLANLKQRLEARSDRE